MGDASCRELEPIENLNLHIQGHAHVIGSHTHLCNDLALVWVAIVVTGKLVGTVENVIIVITLQLMHHF